MPTYEYICEDAKCLKEWEEEQRISDPKTTKCPFCGTESAKRLISNGNFILQGTGWFKSGGY